MATYDFLRGVRVVEVAHLGPSSLGGLLADMGAEVIKIESSRGDPIRDSGSPAVGSTEGPSLLHFRWNRGKQSVGLDLKSNAGQELLKALVQQCDIVIEGMRAGILDELGLGYETLSALRPGLVFCSISGLGRTGPYHTLGSAGPSFDAFGGLTMPRSTSPSTPGDLPTPPLIGMYAAGLYAAIGVISALFKARSTGTGASIEVAGAEASAHWKADGVDVALNPASMFERPGFKDELGRQAYWPRLCAYKTRDDKMFFFQAYADKFWQRFCVVMNRDDLRDIYQQSRPLTEIEEDVFRELQNLFRTRTLSELIELCVKNDIPGGPANTSDDLATDPHFLARNNLYNAKLPNGEELRLTSTPIKVEGQAFTPSLPPDLGEHTNEILGRLLGKGAVEIEALRNKGTAY